MKSLGVITNSFNTERIKSINESFRSFDIIKLHKKTLNFENKYKFQTDKITDAGFKSIFYLNSISTNEYGKLLLLITLWFTPFFLK